MRLSTTLALLPVVLAMPAAERSEPAPLLRRANGTAGKFIVKLKDGASIMDGNSAMSMLESEPERVYKNLFSGFMASMSDEAVEALRHHPDVEYIEQDGTSRIAGYVTQSNAVWGLGRISSRTKGKNTYTYDSSAGEGTCAYVVDTGVDVNHKDFEGRATQVKSWIAGSNVDDNGHGTHCAGTIGSKTYGVAKKTKIYGLKVLGSDGNGADSTIIEAVDFIAEDAPKRNCPKGVVVNMSLTADARMQSMNDAVAGLVSKGYFVSVAAGNYNRDANQDSPASEPAACTVGGTQSDDGRYTSSNYGKLVDINAPAVNVQSTTPGGGSGSMTGTSMAAPHIAGLAAYLASFEGIKINKACERIQELSTKNAIRGLRSDTVNYLAFNGNPSG